MWNNQGAPPMPMGRGFPPFGMGPPMGMPPNPMMGGLPNPAFGRGRSAPNSNPASRYARKPNIANTEPIIPANLEHLFAPRAPLLYLQPIEKKKPQQYTGLSVFVNAFETPQERDIRIANEAKTETTQEKKERKKREKNERATKTIQEQLATWDPKHDPNAKTDPRKTLFVGRLNYSTNDETIKRKMEQYGRVKRVIIVHDKNSKPKGYAFVEFDKERDLKEAYDRADGIKIDDKRIVVDYEKGRVEKEWRPRRLGGGLGGTRIGGKDVNQTHSGRKPPSEDHVAGGPPIGGIREREPRAGDRFIKNGVGDRGNRGADYRDHPDRADRNGPAGERRERYDDMHRHSGSRHRPAHHR